MHRGVLVREELQQLDAFVLAVSVERESEDVLRPIVVGPVAEDETGSTVRGLDAPPGEDARDFDDVLLSVPAVDAKGVELEELARIILVDAGGPTLQTLPALFGHLIHAKPSPEHKDWPALCRRCGARCHALRIVEIEQHRGTLGRRDEQVLEAAECPRPDRFLYIGRQQEAIGALADEHVEMIGPKIDHHLSELSLGQRGTYDGKLLQLTAQLS